jgi:Endonuclease/Exonuclease/phosphatase family
MTRANRLLLTAVLLAGADFGCGGGDGGLVGPGQPITVYTRNLYLGTEFGDLATISSPDVVPARAAMLWANVQATNFPARAKVLAQQITVGAPDLVALQEVSLYRQQVPGDYRPGDPPNATEVALDFLATLMTEIDALGGGYRVAGESPNADVEIPVSDGAGGQFDLRFTDRDVILARDPVQTANFTTMQYSAKFSFMAGGSGGVPVAATRGWCRVDATVADAHFTFADTHLEVQALQTIQTMQAMELLAAIKDIPDPVLLLGDFNSEPGMNSYPMLTGPFRDAYVQSGNSDPGLTCCQQPDLKNATSTADGRIDLVLNRGRFRVNDVAVTGTDPTTNKTPDGLWPSDHFGVLAHVEFVPPPTQ